jgi:hypothetical protein
MKSNTGKSQIITLIASLIAFTSLAAGCATISAGAHYDETTNFGLYKSFSWIDDQPLFVGSDDTGIIVSPLTQMKIQQAIRSGLENKGYEFVDNQEKANFIIAYTIGTRQETSVSSYPDAYYGLCGWHVCGSHYYVHEASAHNYTKGTVGVDIFDGTVNKPVWHGWAEKAITTGDENKPVSSIEAAIREMLVSFPNYGWRTGRGGEDKYREVEVTKTGLTDAKAQYQYDKVAEVKTILHVP